MKDFFAEYAEHINLAFAGDSNLVPPYSEWPRLELQHTHLFLERAFKNCRRAQDWILDALKTLGADTSLPRNEREYRQLLLRRLADGLAYQMVGGNLAFLGCLARDSQIRAVPMDAAEVALAEANRWNDVHPHGFSLISDLTTFIHVGDLLSVDYEVLPDIAIVELKTGSTNEKLAMMIADPDNRLACPYRLSLECSKKEIEQLLRMLKQKVRMFETGAAIEAVAEARIQNELTSLWQYHQDSYGDLLDDVCDSAVERGGAIGVVERCALLGLGSTPDPEHAEATAQQALERALELAGRGEGPTGKVPDEITREVRECWRKGQPVKSCDPFRSNLTAMASVPFLHWPLQQEHIQRLVRRQLCIKSAFDPGRFLWLARDHGFDAQLSTRKQAARLKPERTGRCTWTWDNRVILVNSSPLFPGFFGKVVNDLLGPVAALRLHSRSLSHR